MHISIHGKQMDLGDALRTHISEKISDINEKYFNHATDATVTLSPEGHGRGQVRAHVSIRVGKEIMVTSDSIEKDAYVSFDSAAEKVAKQLRRYKRRIREHSQRLESIVEIQKLNARDLIISEASNDDDSQEEPLGADPVVVAEMTTSIQTLTVSEAVMRMDLSGQPAIMFRSAQHGGLNMVYRRTDGHIGWVDPEGLECKLPAQKKA
jgi:ribosomal subunit interface protein